MAAAGGNDGHPDLTPMLDVVMQLLMYFIMCVKFTAEDINTGIALPPAQTVQVGTRNEGDVILLQITQAGTVRIRKGGGWEEYDAKVADYELEKWALSAPKEDTDPKKVKTVLVVRADQGADWYKVYQFMYLAKKHGFTKFKMRAIHQP